MKIESYAVKASAEREFVRMESISVRMAQKVVPIKISASPAPDTSSKPANVELSSPAQFMLHIAEDNRNHAAERLNARLLELDIGAIFPGDVQTEFSINGDKGESLGTMRSTSFFLKESGGAGTISHIDLTL